MRLQAHAALVEQEQLQLALALSASEIDPPAVPNESLNTTAAAAPTSPTGEHSKHRHT